MERPIPRPPLTRPDELDRRRVAALRRVGEATRGGPEWCAAMAELEDVDAAIGAHDAQHRRRRHLVRGAEALAILALGFWLQAAPIGAQITL